MPRYTTKEIELDELWLDEKNPRFIVPPNATQQSIIDYLIENEEVEQLANDIAKSGGLYAGESNCYKRKWQVDCIGRQSQNMCLQDIDESSVVGKQKISIC